MLNSDFKRRLKQPTNQIYRREKECVIEFIKNFIYSSSFPHNVKDVINYVNQSIGKYYKYRTTYSIIYNDLNLS